ncbi:DUF3558 domain-containing protein [Saccharothrix variisporea]|uniref:Uncharacterized protein DUF3558 n=1 Tax=Saccharothrix variisporea TaxID=543527 RepID=A0A495X8J6_9PSEU|nr:DUF3558 domain-containing protein [Saccharothrix variisporea]RKT70277.1 uncharacterized protein DUF3558 [Saccharothrix variisporea]
MNRILQSVLALTTAALTACTSTNAGTPTPASTKGNGSTTTKSSAKPSGPGALNLQKFTSDPCKILTPAHLAALGGTFDPAKREDSPNGPACIWAGKDVLKDPTYRIVLVIKGATLDTYRGNSKTLKVFREATVAGYPAVSYDTASGTEDCTTVIGSSDKDAVIVQTANSQDGKPCDASEKLGATVVGILKG